MGRSCKNFKKSSNFLGREGERSRVKIGPKRILLQSKAQILVLSKKNISLEESNRSKIAAAESFKIY